MENRHGLVPFVSFVLSASLAAVSTACANRPASPLNEPLPPGVSLEFAEEFYEFRAEGADEIGDALRRFGPEVGDARAAAATSQELDWDLHLAQSGETCRIRGAAVRLQVTMVLPDWINRSNASAELRAAWDRYAESVRQHEDGHLRLYLDGARDLLRQLPQVPAGSCATVRRAADDLGRRSIERYGALNTEYDRETNGGQRQGACWQC